VFNATISNISAISWRPVLVVEEARVPGDWKTSETQNINVFLHVQCNIKTENYFQLKMSHWTSYSNYVNPVITMWTSTCIVRLGDICNALRYSNQYLHVIKATIRVD
jgi:hypothetical protein